MKIGIDASPLVGPQGGIRRYTECLIEGLRQIDSRNDYHLVGATQVAPWKNTEPNFTWERTRALGSSYLRKIHQPGASRLDLYHGTNYFAPILDTVPKVLTVHDLTVRLLPRNHPLKRRLQHRILPYLCRSARYIIADSKNTKLDLIRCYHLPSAKIEVIHLAAGEEFRPIHDAEKNRKVRERYRLPECFVLFLGEINPRKNLHALVEAMADLKREGVSRPLAICGRGERGHVAELTKNAASRGLVIGEDIMFPGGVDDDDLPSLYSQCELFVYPSCYEGFGLPPLEAMSCGAAVLVPDNSSFSELYEERLMLSDLSRTSGLRYAIRRVLTDSARKSQLAEDGLKHAQSRSWQTVAEETLSVYERAASNRGQTYSFARATAEGR